MENLPIVGGFGVVALVIAFRLLTERSEIRDMRADMKDLRLHVARLEGKLEAKSSEKHAVVNRIATVIGTMETATDMAHSCTCGAMRPNLVDLLDRVVAREKEWLDRLSAEQARRADDHPGTTTTTTTTTSD